jgi:hypothetical protein
MNPVCTLPLFFLKIQYKNCPFACAIVFQVIFFSLGFSTESLYVYNHSVACCMHCWLHLPQFHHSNTSRKSTNYEACTRSHADRQQISMLIPCLLASCTHSSVSAHWGNSFLKVLSVLLSHCCEYLHVIQNDCLLVRFLVSRTRRM